MSRFLTTSPVLVLAMAGIASACPMCSTNIEAETLLPKAFMISILFMLAIPPVVLGGIGFAIWRAHRLHALAQKTFAGESAGDSPAVAPAG